MFDTNALLSVAFAMISNFTSVVDIPSEWVPKQSSDLRFCMIGGPVSPVEMNLIHKAGTQFWINHGIVQAFVAPNAYSRLQDPAKLKDYAGGTELSSNDIVRIAYNALKPLVKNGNPLEDGPPRIEYSGFYEGRRIPFFTVVWPKTSPGSQIAAKVEIDGRNSRIVALHVWSPSFYDETFDRQVRQKVNAPEELKLIRPPDHLSWPKPPKDYVAKAIDNWLSFCGKMGLPPGSHTAPLDVDWNQTFEYPQGINSSAPCWIQFKSGAGFGSYHGFVFSHYEADAAFPPRDIRPYSEWEKFEGTPTYDWEPLAKALESRLIHHLGIPEEEFKKAPPKPASPSSIRTGHPLRRVRIMWTQPRDEGSLGAEAEEITCLLRAEFDLQTGDTKSVAFGLWPSRDPRIFRVLREAERNLEERKVHPTAKAIQHSGVGNRPLRYKLLQH